MFVQSIYKAYERLRKIAESKFHRNLFFSILLTISFFGVFNSYASSIDVLKTHEDAVLTVESMTGIEQENTQALDNKMTAAKILNIGIDICPGCYSNYDSLLNNPDVSPATKAGWVGLANDNLKAMMYNPPTVDIGSHLAQEWIPGYESTDSSVYAAGYEELERSGVSSIWSRTRNIAYLMFVVVMIVAGFMIMFRSKLGGQTVVTLGNMIPNVIIALVLVTFSFAIVGLIIDFGAMLCNVVVELLYGRDSELLVVTTQDPFTLLFKNWRNMGRIRREDLFSAFADPVGVEAITDIVRFVSKVITPGAVVEELFGIKVNLITIIVSGIMLVGAIKVWITLLKSYLSILINTILAPIQIAISAIPGQAHMLGNWFKSTLKNVLVFPVVLAIVNLPFALWGDDLTFTGLPEGLVRPGVSMEDSDSSWEFISAALEFDEFVVNILKIVVLFMAAQAPKFLEAVFPPNSPKAMAEGVGQAKQAFSKIPLVGKLFG